MGDGSFRGSELNAVALSHPDKPHKVEGKCGETGSALTINLTEQGTAATIIIWVKRNMKIQVVSFRYRKNFYAALKMLGIYIRQGAPDCLTAKIDQTAMTITFT